ERLFALLEKRHPHGTVPLAVLKAVVHQPQASVTDAQRDFLRRAVFDEKLGRQTIRHVLRAHATWTLAIFGTAEDARRLLDLIASSRGVSALTKRSAAITLGILIARQAPEERIGLVDDLLRLYGETRDLTTRNFACMALVPIVQAGPPDTQNTLLDRTLVGEFLLVTAAYGRYHDRTHAALALGSLLREQAGRTAPPADFRQKAERVLRGGIEAGEPRSRAAFAVALGLAGDHESEGAIREVARDAAQDPVLRAYALLGLSLLVPRENPTRHVMRDSLPERRSEIHRILAARALGIVRDEASVDALAAELREGRSSQHKGEAAIALARIGTEEAANALLRLAADTDEHAHTRSVALAGLGRLIDAEPLPSLLRLTSWTNYRASTDLLNELLSLL
ncbi:MAG: HEAT repeat domain-containing protein, partial [Planctomycetota bacterium]